MPVFGTVREPGDTERSKLTCNMPYGQNAEDAQDGEEHVAKAHGTLGDPSSSKIGFEEDTDTSSELLIAWMDRLQTLTVVTTFLVSVDSQMFSLTTENNLSRDTSPASQQLVYACLSGASVFHLCAVITAYIASFALIRYRIVDASAADVQHGVGSRKISPWGTRILGTEPSPKKIVLERIHPRECVMGLFRDPKSNRNTGISSSSFPPPLSLLKRCYYTTLCQTAVGFILALTGILSYSWAGLSVQVGGFSTVCLGIGVGTGLWAMTS
ncbi:hypothetical protein F5141DRAFT_1212520 [Pisolithus sp. B1]|nr:hypothetical protein F5141DRAFT_1212520 [Pisolithus sp. B1]